MMKILLFLVVSSAMTNEGSSMKLNHTEADISFVDTNDESEPIRDKIRSEMETYKMIKEMILKNKIGISTTVKTEAIKIEETTQLPTTISSSSEVTEEETTQETTETAIITSTLRQISLILPDANAEEEEEVEENPEEVIEETTSISQLEDRFLINAPTLCKNGKVSVSGTCRQIVKFS